MKALILFLAMGVVLPGQAAPAPKPADAEQAVLQRDRLKLLGAVQDWSDYLAKAPPEAQQKYAPELAEVKAAAETAKTVEELKPLELRLEAWRRALLYQLFPDMSKAWGRTPETVALAQAQVEAFASLQKLEGSALSGMKKDSIAKLKSRVGQVADQESLSRLFDNAGLSAPPPLPQSVFQRFYAASHPSLSSTAGLRVNAPPQSQAAAPTLTDEILSFLDPVKAKHLAQYALSHAVGFMHRCYEYAGNAIEKVLGWDSRIGSESAYMFAKSLNSNPKLFDKLKLRRVDPSSLPGGVPPIGAIIVYGRGVCGFSPQHGHIEVVVSQNPPKACSDGCMPITGSRLDCIKQNSARQLTNVYVPAKN